MNGRKNKTDFLFEILNLENINILRDR